MSDTEQSFSDFFVENSDNWRITETLTAAGIDDDDIRLMATVYAKTLMEDRTLLDLLLGSDTDIAVSFVSGVVAALQWVSARGPKTTTEEEASS